MNIKLSHNWIKDFVTTATPPEKIAEYLSLTSVSVERMEKIEDDIIFDIEVTQNRPDLMSAQGIAREVAAILPQFGENAKFHEHTLSNESISNTKLPLVIKNDTNLVGRICAVAFEVQVRESPAKIRHRLETSGIRSLNNIIDVTNYVMREIGHPTHVFDLDLLSTKVMRIAEAKKGEKIVTLDNKIHTLHGGDIVAYNDSGEIIDLLGVMGTKNSVVNKNTKRVLFFIDNNEPHQIRRTSMSLGIRSEAAVLNEKGVDPKLAMMALKRGMELFEEIADGRQISEIIDIYPSPRAANKIAVTKEKIETIIGVRIPEEIITKSLPQLGFDVIKNKDSYSITPPSFRIDDVQIEEDIAEEVARIYGYHNIPNILPPASSLVPYSLTKDRFYWEGLTKNFLKDIGYTECYTYSMVSETQYEGKKDNAFILSNELNSEHSIMRTTLIPSLLSVLKENPTKDTIRIFEIANTYQNASKDGLPEEILHFAGIVKGARESFYATKGILENIFRLLGIENAHFEPISTGGEGADILIGKEIVGNIEVFDEQTYLFEMNFDTVVANASNKKNYTPIALYPPIIEDLRFIIDPKFTYKNIVTFIKDQSDLIEKVELLDIYKDKKTFRIYYQDRKKNLTNEDITPIRQKLISSLQKKFGATIS